MENKIKPALIGGVILGLLSAIPFVGVVNACCCAWAIVGGLAATYFYVKDSATPARPADGAVLGVIAGLIGAVIYVILGIPLGILTGNATLALIASIMGNINPEAAIAMEQQAALMQNQSVGALILSSIPGALIGAVLLIIFATIGGLIGVPLFEKRKGGGAGVPPPPAPGGYAVGGGGGYNPGA